MSNLFKGFIAAVLTALFAIFFMAGWRITDVVRDTQPENRQDYLPRIAVINTVHGVNQGTLGGGVQEAARFDFEANGQIVKIIAVDRTVLFIPTHNIYKITLDLKADNCTLSAENQKE